MNQLIDPIFWLEAFPNIFIAFTIGFWIPYLTNKKIRKVVEEKG